MRPSLLLSLLAIGLAACGSSSVTADASTDVATDATADVSTDRVAVDVARDATTDAPGDRVEPACDVPGTFTFGFEGGLTPFTESSRVEPGRRFTWTRTAGGRVDAGTLTCATMLPYCGASDGGTVDTLAVINALGDPDVAAAFADQTETLYGVDPRPVDGQVFAIQRADGRHVEVGGACGGSSGCRAIPAGLERLRTVLTALITQELARPECAAARP